MKAFTKDIVRTIRGSMKRFLSIVAICALGATMLTGLSMACIDLRAAASALYRSQHLFDISVQSTYGLTDEDIAELAAVDGVAQAEGGFEETTYTLVDGLRATVTVKALLADGMNEPYVVEGRLPESANEVAVTEKYLKDSGKQIGDTLEFEDAEQDDPTGLSDEPSTGAIPGGTYTIVGTVVDPANITQPDGPIAFRASTSSDYTFFVSDRAVQDDATYTIAYLAVSGAEDLPAYSEAYDARVDEVQARVEDLAPQRERARAQAIKDEAMAEIDDQEANALAELADAESELDDAQAEIDENRTLLEQSAAELADGLRTFTETLPSARQQLIDGQAALDAAYDEFYNETLPALEQQRDELAQAVDTIPGSINQLDTNIEQLAEGLDTMAQNPMVGLIPGLANQLSTLSQRISTSWSALQTVNPNNQAATSSAIDAFATAIEDTANTVSPFSTIIESLLQSKQAQIEQKTEQLEQADATLQDIATSIETNNEEVAQVEEQLAGMDETDPEYASLAERRDQLLAENTQLAEEQAKTQEERDALSSSIAELQSEVQTYTEYQQGLQSIINLADPDNPQNARELAQLRVELPTQLAQAQAGLTQLDEALASAPSQAEAEFARQQGAIDAGWQELWDAYAQLADAQAQLDDGFAQLDDAQAELDDGRATFEEERDDALAQIADARADVNAVEPATWYVQNRSGLGSYSSVDSDASSIETIANIIPVIFYIVAILVSLTTATRMVEEERTLIGLYKALGYSKARILSKYLAYTATAALIGGILGDILGFVLIPYILFYIFQAMYLLPLFSLQFNLFYAVLGVAAFVIGIAGSTFITCRADLRETPASLMRPRAPRAGSRIFLEHIRPLWRRLGFLNKVTARNLFRYKKRFAMTVFGIMGCTALLICGFSIKNTVESLAPRQYEDIYRYDLMAVTQADDFETCQALLEDSDEVRDLQALGIDNITVEFDSAKESMQLYVVPRGASIESYVNLETLSGEPIDLDEAGVVITNNAATVLGLAQGDTVQLTTTALDEADAPVNAITRNYLGNAVYMTQDAYEELFGEPLELNGFFAYLAGDNAEQLEFADELEASEDFLSIMSTAKMHQQFEKSFTLINVVVYVIIGLAAGLAFVVLFTLSTVNIGEREREIATIKVLGFRVGEVRTYINKETFVLTLIGILVGLPAGWALSESFTYILKMPSIFFDVEVAPWCYALAAAFSVVFALVVSRITNRMLDRVNMVEALKSPE